MNERKPVLADANSLPTGILAFVPKPTFSRLPNRSWTFHLSNLILMSLNCTVMVAP